MPSILFKIVRICNSQFKCNYLTNKKLFLNFLFNFWNLHQNLKILKKGMIVIANVFPKVQTVKVLVRQISKKIRFRTLFDIQHVKASQILAKSSWERFCQVFPSFSGKLICQMAPLVLGEVLVLFFNRLSADGKCPVISCETLHSQFKYNDLKNENIFLNFVFHFWNLHQFLSILKKRMIVIADLFPKLQTVTILVRPLYKKRCFRTRFERQHVKASQILAKFPWDCFCHVVSSFWGMLTPKMSPLVLGETLVVFFNRLTPDGKYHVQDCKILQIRTQIKLSEKQKTFS